MTVSTDEQMNRRFSRKPTSALCVQARGKARRVFMVGGMANLTFRDIAEQYFGRRLLLSEKIRNGDWETIVSQSGAIPYRHSIRAFIKDSPRRLRRKRMTLDKIVRSSVRCIKASSVPSCRLDQPSAEELALSIRNNGIPLQPEL